MVNVEDRAPNSLSSSSLNGIRLCSFYLLSLGLCGFLHPTLTAELSEVAPSFELPWASTSFDPPLSL